MNPSPTSSDDPHAILLAWVPPGLVGSLYGAVACLGRLQRCLEQLEAPGLRESRRLELQFFLDAQTRLLNRQMQRLLSEPTASAKPLALDGLLASLAAWFGARQPAQAVQLRLAPGALLIAGPVAGRWLALQLLLQHALAQAGPGAAVEVVVADGAGLPNWTGQVSVAGDDHGPSDVRAAPSRLAPPSTVDGLAFSLAQQLFHAFGGVLEARGRLGEGGCLQFSLPKHDVTRRWTVVRPKVLVIDDDADMRSFLAEHLAEAGFDIQSAADSSTGLDLAQALQPHVILLDLHLAPLDGKAVLARLRDRCQAPVVFLSAIADKAYVAESLWLGAADYITKPFHIRELVVRLRAIVRRHWPAPAATLSPELAWGLRPVA